MKSRADLAEAEAVLRKICLAYPLVTEEFPWGERALKIKGKVFAFLSLRAGALGMSIKLPDSSMFALMQPFAEPTGYGLGKSGWVTCRFEKGDAVPVDLLARWIDESYRAIAPKKILAALFGAPPQGRKTPDKKPAKKSAKAVKRAQPG